MVKYLNFLTGVPEPPALAGGQNVRTGSDRDGARYDAILERASLEEMWQPQLPAELDSNGNKGFVTDVGLVYFIDARNGRKLVGHGGDQNGFISYIDFQPATRTASIIVMNTNVAYPANTPPEMDVVSKLRKAVRSLF